MQAGINLGMSKNTAFHHTGPGFTVELDYTAGNLTTLPAEAPVYLCSPIPFSRQALAEIAARLGVTGEIREEAWQDGITYAVGEADGKMLIAFPDGYYSYNLALSGEFTTRELPAREVLEERAKTFFMNIGIEAQSAVVREMLLPQPDDYYPLAYVTLTPGSVPRQVSYAPAAWIALGPKDHLRCRLAVAGGDR